MNRFIRPAVVAGVAGTMAFAGMTASQARPLDWAAAGVGFAAGAAVGAVAATANAAYYDGYAYDPYAGTRYAPRTYVAPRFSYAPGDAYAYAPEYPGYRYSPAGHGYDSNYIGPWKERQLEGRDY